MFALTFAGAIGVLSALAAASCRVAQQHDVRLRFRERTALAVIGLTLTAEAVVLWRYPGPQTVTSLIALATVGVASVTDLQTGYIFDAVTAASLVSIWTAAAINDALAASLAGTVVVGAVFVVLYMATCGRGIGLGDGKLGACIGAALGMQKGIVAIEIAFVLGGLCAALLLLRRRASFGAEIRFAPYMALGLLGAMVCR